LVIIQSEKTMTYKTVYDLNKDSFNSLKGTLGLTNPMQAPRLLKVVISCGFGSVKDKKKIELIENRLSRITGQKPAVRTTKKAIASFKTRLGDPIGYQITLRGKRMYEFLDKLIHIAFPRTKDFRGIPETNVDSLGNMTTGIKEHTIFPEIHDEELKDVFSLAISLVTTAKSKEEALAFFKLIGMPFKK
jgi:large subunit ribosomal protein L5